MSWFQESNRKKELNGCVLKMKILQGRMVLSVFELV